ncbi:hypothetical protein KAU33_00065 [Candidatus Dependentiae bacterium]|nr:hypothetical protein [Candidatus Dependentiae bacterium]
MQVKGLLIEPIYEFLRCRYGESFLSKIFTHLSQKEEQVLHLKISTAMWYPYEFYIDLLNSIHSELNSESPEVMREMGVYAAEFALKTPYHLLFRFGTPKFLIRIGNKAYRTYFDEGKFKAFDLKDKSVLIKISQLSDINDLNFEIILGWMEGAFALTGGKNPRAILKEKYDKEEKYVIIKGTWDE